MKIKICGLRRQADLEQAATLGADFCGFVFHARSARLVEVNEVSKLRTFGMKRVGVFTSDNYVEIMRTITLAKLDYAQLHNDQPDELALRIGPEKIIRVLWPDRFANADDLIACAESFKNSCAYYLLDAGHMGGGHGRTCGWSKLRGLRLPKPWFLAGGLNELNAQEAIESCQPWGLDFNSGLEDGPALKNHNKMAAALAACKMETKC